MVDKGALKPAYYEDITNIWQKKQQEKKENGIDLDDESLSNLSQTYGWKILKEHIDNLKVGLDKRLSESVLSSLGDAQIKTDALFAVLGKELLNSIVNKVEDSALVVTEIKNEQQQAGASK